MVVQAMHGLVGRNRAKCRRAVRLLALALTCALNSLALHGQALDQTLAVSQAQAMSEVPRSVEDLRYGVALYHFFQQSYFNALTELMAAEQLGDLPHHGEQAQLLRGGISLSWGLPRAAERIFNELLLRPDANVLLSADGRDTAWFYLAKLKQQRGDLPGALDALGQIATPWRFPQAQEAIALQANLLLRANRLADAAQMAATLPQDSAWLPYYFFNLGALQTAQGDWRAGVAAFAKLQELPLTSEEAKTLRDRAWTAAGFAYLGAEEYGFAAEAFRQVRLDSLLVNQAMLGYGWAAAGLEDYRLALGPWQRLREGSLLDASVQESLLAVPYAYERMHANGSALGEYQRSTQTLEQEIARIDRVIEQFAQQDIAALLQLEVFANSHSHDAEGGLAQASLRADWFSHAALLPDTEYGPYLTQLVAGHEFQQQMRELQELYRLASFLDAARQRLDLFATVLEEREVLWREKVAGGQFAQLQQRYAALQTAAAELEYQLAQARAEQDGILLLDSEQQNLWRRVTRSQASIEHLAGAGEEVEEAREQLHRYRGLLLWQASEDYVPRQWELQQQLDELGRQLREIEPALARIGGLQANPADFGFERRIAELQARTQAQRQQVAQQLAAHSEQLKNMAIAELSLQRQRLEFYLGQTSLAIARLYDKGVTDRAKLTGAQGAAVPEARRDGATP